MSAEGAIQCRARCDTAKTKPRGRFDPRETAEHGFFEFPHTSLGRFKLEITAKGFQRYSTDVYMPSDFSGNWALQLKAEAPSPKSP